MIRKNFLKQIQKQLKITVKSNLSRVKPFAEALEKLAKTSFHVEPWELLKNNAAVDQPFNIRLPDIMKQEVKSQFRLYADPQSDSWKDL